MLKNTLINMLGVLIPGLLAIPAMAYLARALDVELFGILLLSYSILGYSGIFDAGLTRAVIRKIASNESLQENRAIMGTAIVTVLGLSILPSLFIYFYATSISGWLNVSEGLLPQVVPAIELVAIVVPFFLVGVVAFAYLEGKQQFLILNKYKIFTGLLLALMPAVMVSVFNSLLAAITGLLIARVLTAGIGLLSLKKAIGTFKLSFDRVIFFELITFGGWITFSNIISPLMVYADRFILSNALGANKVAFYNAPADLIEKIAILPGAVARTIFPLFSQNSHNVAKQERLAYIGLMIVLFAILTPMFFLAHWLLNLWLGEPYGQESSKILQVLIVGFFFNALAQIPFSRVQAFGKSRTTALMHLCEVGPYLALLFYLVNQYGLIGAAYAWSLRVFVDFILLIYFSKKYKRHL